VNRQIEVGVFKNVDNFGPRDRSRDTAMCSDRSRWRKCDQIESLINKKTDNRRRVLRTGMRHRWWQKVKGQGDKVTWNLSEKTSNICRKPYPIVKIFPS